MTSYAEIRQKVADGLRSSQSQALITAEKATPAAISGELVPSEGHSAGIFSGREQATREAYNLFRHWVYVCVNAIARRLAGQPISAASQENAAANPERATLYGLQQQIQRKRMPPRMRAKFTESDNIEVLAAHGSLDLLSCPNPIQGKFEFLYMSAIQILITGEAYWVGGVRKDSEGNLKPEIWAVPTSWLEPIHKGGYFTGYLLKTKPGQDKPIPPENVARTYFCDPSDIKKAYAPLRACISAVRTDDYIQTSQEESFARGIWPNVVITVGKQRGPQGMLTDRRPVLMGHHRRQFIRAIKQVWQETVGQGDPAIVDGLIESIHKLQNTPLEMDWPGSGEIVKRRVMQTYGVNPITVGEIVGANRAQAYEARRQTADMAINPLADAFSETLTEWIGPWYEEPNRLLIWVEPYEPIDPELDLKRWAEGLKSNSVTQDEYRVSQLGLPPLDREEKNALLSTVGGMTGAVQILSALSQGGISSQTAAQLFVLFFDIPLKRAIEIIGEEEDRPPPAPAPQPRPPSGGDDEEGDEDLDEEGDHDLDQDLGENQRAKKTRSGKPARLSRRRLEQTIVKQQTDSIGDLGRAAARHFLGLTREISKEIAQLEVETQPERAEEQAKAIVDAVFGPKQQEEATRELIELCVQPQSQAFARAALSELVLHSGLVEKTTAEEIAARLEIDLPPEIAIGAMPDWLLDAAREYLSEAFDQDYWTEIHATTYRDVLGDVTAGIEEGWPIVDVARAIQDDMGADYALWRAMRIARTETPDALNAGHSAGIRELEEETGLPIGKEWVSVLGNTTRADHAAMDGQQTDGAEGLFELAGIRIPWPAHFSLPPGQRCNCQCTVISAVVMNELVEQTPPPQTPEDALDWNAEALQNMEGQEIANSHPALEEVRQKVLKAAEPYRRRTVQIESELHEIRVEIEGLNGQGTDLVDQIMATPGDPFTDPAHLDLKDRLKEIQTTRKGLYAKMQSLGDEHKLIGENQRKALIEPLSVPETVRQKMPLEFQTERMNTFKDKRKRCLSTGKWTKKDRANVKEAQEFVERVTAPGFRREDVDTLYKVRMHVGTPTVRASHLGTNGQPFDLRSRRQGLRIAKGEPVQVIVHEMGHHVESQAPGVNKRTAAFVKYRVNKAGTKNVGLRKEFKGHGFDAWEVGNEDEFWRLWATGDPENPVRQKVSSAFYVGKEYDSGHTELMSMGVQELYRDAANFARRDPEWFRFMIGVLQGVIR
jgi:phage portal protein BeeE